MKNIVDGIERKEGRLIVHPSSHLSDVIREPIQIECSGVAFTQCPDTISAVPLILNVAPIIWRLGGTWGDEYVDRKLMKSMDLSRRALAKLYPQYVFSGRILSNCADPEIEEDGGVALLYSGGLDSSFSFFDHVSERPLLLTIHGDLTKMIEGTEQWGHISSSAAGLMDRFGVEHLSITSNFTRIFHPTVLDLFPDLPAGYWSSIQHGLGFSGVAAPIMHSKKRGVLVIGASYTVGSNRSWGSHPFVEGVLEWCGGSVRHHGYSHNRIEKIECLSRMAKNHDYNPRLIVCSDGKRSSINCLNCSKCFRTLANILVSNCEPRDFGFRVEPRTGI